MSSRPPARYRPPGNNFQSQYMIGRNAIDECMRAACVFADIADNGARALAARVGYVIESLRIQRITQMKIDQAGLNNCSQIIVIDLEDTVHAGECNNDPTINRDGSSTQARARASWYNRHVVMGGNFDNSRYIFCGCW